LYYKSIDNPYGQELSGRYPLQSLNQDILTPKLSEKSEGP